MGRADEQGIMQWALILAFEDNNLEKQALVNRIKEQTVQIYSHIEE